MDGLRHELRLVAVALQFLTRVPVPAFRTWDDDWLNGCVRHFPLVGAAIGAFGAAVLWAAAQVWPPLVAAVLSVAATAWLTGAFHEDGLADTADGLGGAVDRERALAIMKDSRIGSYGALALGLVTLLRVAALATLAAADPMLAAAACVWAHAAARAVPVAVMAALPYAGDAAHAKAKPLAVQVQAPQAVAAGLWVMAVTAVLWPISGLSRPFAAAAALLLVVVVMTRWLRRRLGGYTGDTLGASEQMAEVTALLVLGAGLGTLGAGAT